MAELIGYNIMDNWISEGTYTSERYQQYKGYAIRNGILASILDATVDATVASWRVEGKKSGPIVKMLDEMRGHGKENFRTIMRNMLWISMVAGDSYAEILYDDDEPVDMITLPPDRVTQHIKDGRIVKYEDNTSHEKFKPDEIFHLPYNSYGAQCNGISVIQRLEPVLLSMEQLIDRGNKLYEMWSKPLILAHSLDDDQGQMDKLADRINKTFRTAQAALVVPAQTVEKIERVGVPEGSGLDITKWFRVLLDHLLMSCRVSENILGIGTQNSEESARMQLAGFRQLVRVNQKFLADHLETQLFTQKLDKPPKIRFSFATESQEEELERHMKELTAVTNSQIDPQLKSLAEIKKLIDMKVIEDE